MTLKVQREKRYNGPLQGTTAAYFAYLGSEQLANDPTKDGAMHKAWKTLLEAYKYVGSTTEVRPAKDGTIILVRQTGEDCAQVEYNRLGKSSGISTGRMTNGEQTFRSVREYADYILSAYES